MRTRPVASILALLVLWICTAMPALAQSAPKSLPEARGPETVATQFADAWNAHDTAVLHDLIAADVEWVTASGRRLAGRDKVRAFLAEEHATWAKSTRLVVSNVYVRHLNRSTAMVFFEWQIMSTKKSADDPPRRGNNLFIVREFGPGWIIVAGQVARGESGTRP